MKMVYWVLIVNVVLLIWSTIIVFLAKKNGGHKLANSWKVLFLLFISLHFCAYFEIYFKMGHLPGAFLLRGIQLLIGVIMCVFSFKCIYSKESTLQESMMYLMFIGLSTCSIILRYV